MEEPEDPGANTEMFRAFVKDEGDGREERASGLVIGVLAALAVVAVLAYLFLRG